MIKIWHFYDLNGTTLTPEDEDFELSIATPLAVVDSADMRTLLKSKGVKETLLDLYNKHSEQLCKCTEPMDVSDLNETVYISQEVIEFFAKIGDEL
jgi:hypothetical protein